jgi:uncharacterized membrane protein YphA (DoxX/SURF4 family)
MKNKASSGLNTPLVLFIIFLVLKLTNNIDWSWWWVTSPLWIPIAFILGIIIVAVLLLLIMIGFGLINVKELKNKIEERKKSIKI